MATRAQTPTPTSKPAKSPKPRSTRRRDGHGRFEPRTTSHQGRTAAIGVAAGLGVLAAGVATALRFGLFDRLLPAGNAEHAAPDLALGAPRPEAGDRAPVAFRPDPTAPVTAAERESLRPPAPVSTGFTEEKHSELVR